ncbi:MAG: nucleoside kinase [Eubacterium sp.]|nr:nucleoside kinase [Eubacterium sp.]
MGQIHIKLEGKDLTYPEGTSLYQLAKDYEGQYDAPIMVAFCDGIVQELYHELYEGEEVSFCTLSQRDGTRVYMRGVSMLLLKSIYSLCDKDAISKVTVDYAIDSGYFCRIHGAFELDQEKLDQIESKMREYVKKDIVFEKEVISTRYAKQLFEKYGMEKKALLCDFRKTSRMTIYKLGNFIDYYYGAMPYSTGFLKDFRLELFEDGFVFVIPKRNNPKVLPAFSPSMKLYQTMQQTNEWGEKLNVATVAEFNQEIVRGNLRELMMTQEALHEKRIGDIAEQIAERGSRIVTIAGPSSSGKTTFSYRLSTQLKTLGLRPHPLGLDDYFVNRVDTPKDKDGNYNFECLEALDIKTLNENLTDLLEGKEVQLPTYNFITGKREYNKPLMKIEEDEILVIEGIHGLNDKLTYSIPASEKYKIYISALTTLNLDNHNRIPTTEGRLIRRIIRDARTRGNSARKTISMWNSVRAGENQNIFPFQEQADSMFNSSLIYELAAMKLYADPVLFQVPKGCPEYSEARRILKFLDYFIPIDPHEVPLNSILREFIGGGILLN